MSLKCESMNLDMIRTFVKVGQSKSIKEATAKLNIDSSNVSRHIKTLETELKTKLIRKNNGILELTEDGRLIFEEYEKAYNLIVLAEKKLIQNKSLNCGKISLGISSDLEISYLFKILKKFNEKYPNVVIKIINDDSRNLYNNLSQYSIDFVIDRKSDLILDMNDFETKQLFKLKYCFVYNNHKLQIEDNIKTILENTPLIVPISSSYDRKILNEFLNKNKINGNIKYEIQNSEHLLKYVMEGMGIGFVSENLIKDNKNLTKIINLEEMETDICVSYIPEILSSSTKEFLKYIEFENYYNE